MTVVLVSFSKILFHFYPLAGHIESPHRERSSICAADGLRACTQNGAEINSAAHVYARSGGPRAFTVAISSQGFRHKKAVRDFHGRLGAPVGI
jgi:hypothetical protein